ncbi:hypothetical protein [Mycoplana dimorpha]|uniref:Uncharacterized protein n=1 Tax=Mycoplana dimorpha TaxID=28320 RepID=A0A2T5BAW9_MYCDI|nr:hypothetical protein [Mycoplana dimorpha]PTM96117.1 hypothetical protein C7449_103131 [Mycoplana dimorpha]
MLKSEDQRALRIAEKTVKAHIQIAMEALVSLENENVSPLNPIADALMSHTESLAQLSELLRGYDDHMAQQRAKKLH